MNVILNIIVLIFEVLYYSLFMKNSKNDGKLWKYILLFAIITISGGFIGTSMFISFAYLIFGSLIGIKLLVKAKTQYFDLFVIVSMILFKYVIELIFYIPLINIINYFVLMVVVGLIKIIIVLLLKNRLNKIYMYLLNMWNKNVFYIRYICTCILYIYFIICAFHIFIFVR